MKALLIDPHAQTVREVETSGTIEDMYALMDCNILDIVRLGAYKGTNITMFVDDEGLLKPNRYFYLLDDLHRRTPYPYAGKSLVFGEIIRDPLEGGETHDDCPVPADTILRRIEWMPEGFEFEPVIEIKSWPGPD